MDKNNILERIIELCNKNNLTIAGLERECGFGNGTVKKWGSSMPSGDRLDKVARRFGVTIDYLVNGNSSDGYYLNEETAKIAQEVFENPDMRSLFHASRDLPPEALKAHINFMKSLKEKEQGSSDF
jgi:Predicted transcriptional regulators